MSRQSWYQHINADIKCLWEQGMKKGAAAGSAYQFRCQGREFGPEPLGQGEGVRVIVQLAGHLLAHL